MRIYISLPISGRDIGEARQHADLVKSYLSKQGHGVINPFDIYAGSRPEYFDYICADLRALSDCEAIILCKGWQNSKGCRLERAFAEIYDKKIFVESSYLPQNEYQGN